MLAELSIDTMISTGTLTMLAALLPPAQIGSPHSVPPLKSDQLSCWLHSVTVVFPGFTMISRFPLRPGQVVTLMHSPGGTGSLVVHSSICGCPSSGLVSGYCIEFAGKWTMRTPAGAWVWPWLHTGITPSHGTPTARSMPVQLGSVSPGYQGVQLPVVSEGSLSLQSASQTVATRSTQSLDHSWGGSAGFTIFSGGPSQTAP